MGVQLYLCLPFDTSVGTSVPFFSCCLPRADFPCPFFGVAAECELPLGCAGCARRGRRKAGTVPGVSTWHSPGMSCWTAGPAIGRLRVPGTPQSSRPAPAPMSTQTLRPWLIFPREISKYLQLISHGEDLFSAREHILSGDEFQV